MKISVDNTIEIYLGARAATHVRSHGLQAHDISAVVAAAGGPKGLALLPLDHYLFGEWLRDRSVQLIGASIGAWRMACGAQADSGAALKRLQTAYLGQRYPHKPSTAYVAQECRQIAQAVFAEHTDAVINSRHHLQVITARGTGALAKRTGKAAFALATAANTRSRQALSAHLQRVVFDTRPTATVATPQDRFGHQRVAFTPDNVEDALLASGSIPLICDPVRNIAHAPHGLYWDGGLIDYHPHFPFAQAAATSGGLVLYPHFTSRVIPGWLDKFLPWRAQRVIDKAGTWLDNVVLISPHPALLARLPNGKLPDRKDFYRYGLDHDRRIADWQRAIGQCEAMRDAFARWAANPKL